jgi:UDP-glucose:(heptosyl)LPS alpha-1,3-glucosyltransferase
LNKKIYLIRANSTKFGGAENYLLRLSKALTSKKLEHEIINSFFPKFLPSSIRAILFNLQVCISKNDKLYYSLERITCPDIYRAGDGVHKVFLTIEDKSKYSLLHPVYLFLERRCFRNAKRIIANSNMVKKQIISTYSIDPGKIDVIYNGIELKTLNYAKSLNKLSKEFSIDTKQPILLFVGSGFQRKGVAEFLRILSQLKTKNVKAFIIGKEKKINYYINLSKKLDVFNQVIFTGTRLDVEDFYTIGDILLLPTHYDPFSNVVLEAMNFETAVFTTINNGASEILENHFIMKSPDDERVVSVIDNLLADKSKLDAVKAKNKSLSKNFSIENNLSKTLRVIDQIEK